MATQTSMETRIAKTTFKRWRKIGNLSQPHFKTSYKATTIHHCVIDVKIDQWNPLENLDTLMNIFLTKMSICPKFIEHSIIFHQMMLKCLSSHIQNPSVLITHHIQKFS